MRRARVRADASADFHSLRCARRPRLISSHFHENSPCKQAAAFPSSAPAANGVLAQLVERLNGIQEVRGSNPLGSTILSTMFYAYILQSTVNPSQLYRGHTSDLKQRLADHNDGRCPHTAKYLPWKVKFYAPFETLELAQTFERYLKNGSGHSFARRHFGI